MRDARSKSSLVVVNKGQRILVPSASLRGQGDYFALPLDDFETAFLNFVRELTPQDVVEQKVDDHQSRLAILRGNLAKVESRILELKKQLEDVDAELDVGIVGAIASLQSRRKQLRGEIETLRSESLNSQAKNLEETHSLLELLKDAEDQRDLRARLATALRNIVQGIWVAHEEYELCPKTFPDRVLRSVYGARTRSVSVFTIQVNLDNGCRSFWYIEQGRAKRYWLGLRERGQVKTDLEAWNGEQLYPDLPQCAPTFRARLLGSDVRMAAELLS